MEKLQNFMVRHERKILTAAIYIFFAATLLSPFISEFSQTLKSHKNDILLIILVSSTTIIFTFLRNIDWKSATNRPMLYHYKSSAADMTEIEEQMERYRNCELIVLGNTLTTMWNSLLKRYFIRVQNGEVSSKLRVVFIKRVEKISSFDPKNDPVIPQIEDWHRENGSSISIKIFITEQKISFTGICANREFLKFRMIGSSRSREVFGRAFKGDDEISDRIIEWFCFSCSQIAKGGKLIKEFRARSSE